MSKAPLSFSPQCRTLQLIRRASAIKAIVGDNVAKGAGIGDTLAGADIPGVDAKVVADGPIVARHVAVLDAAPGRASAAKSAAADHLR